MKNNNNTKDTKAETQTDETETEIDFSKDLIKSINTTLKSKCAYNLSEDVNPTNVDYYISTGSHMLDYIISNRKNGGIPVGRLIEISGQESTGKSLICLQILRSTQKMGGIAVLLDTENATDTMLLESLGVDINKRFIYAQPKTVEEVFTIIEHIVKKVKLQSSDVPITCVWDSVAATPSLAELDGTYEQNTVGLSARTISKGLRKITQFIGENKVTLVFANQLKMKIGVSMFEDPFITAGGKAIPYHASVRLQLTRKKSSDIKENDEILGIGVKAKVIKNKIAPPFRSCEFSIGFYKGVLEHEQLFSKMTEESPITLESGYTVTTKNGAWYSIQINDAAGSIVYDKKFRKPEISEQIFNNNEIKEYVSAATEKILIKHYSAQEEVSSDEMLAEIEKLDEL